MFPTWIQSQSAVIVYVGDPLCSWCYGFAPVVATLPHAFPDAEFQIVLGGLRPHGTETMADLGEFLREHWAEVHERTGQPFNEKVTYDVNYLIDTEPSCRAIVAARMLSPEQTLLFFQAVQHAFFVENKSMVDPQTFYHIADSLGFDRDAYSNLYESEVGRESTLSDFKLTHSLGVSGFPAVLVKTSGSEGKWYYAASGYTSQEVLLERIRNILKE